MGNRIIRNLRIFFTDPRWIKVRGVFWFLVISLAFHVLWRLWVINLHFWPVSTLIISARQFLVHQLYDQTVFILRDVLNVTIYTDQPVLITKNGVRLILGGSASGLKQMCQFAVVILLFSGQWRHKAWFIPLGLVILHLTNIFRILCLVVIAMHWPQQIHYAHDNYLRILYYLVIFGLWLVWVEKILPASRKPKSG